MPTRAHSVLRSRERPALHQRNGKYAKPYDDFRSCRQLIAREALTPFRCSSPARNPPCAFQQPTESESLCRRFLRAFTRQPIGPTIAVFTRSANCVFLLAANSGVCARRCWSWLRLTHSGRAAAWDRKGKCTSCASRAWSLSRGQDPLLLTMEVCRTRLARPFETPPAVSEIVRPGSKSPSRRYTKYTV